MNLADAASAFEHMLSGQSGVALGLPGNFIAAGLAKGAEPDFTGVAGLEAILAGSCSTATRKNTTPVRLDLWCLGVEQSGRWHLQH